MSWNYRVVKTNYTATGETGFAIHEVYYDKDDKITSTTVSPVVAYGETLEELKLELQMMLADTEEPIIEESEVVPPEAFKTQFLKALAERYAVSVSTIEAWLRGKVAPHESVQSVILKELTDK